MPLSPPTLLLRSIHTLAEALRRVGLGRADLTPENLIAEAHRRTGLTDFGPTNWEEPFRQLVAAYDSDPQLGAVGRYAMRSTFIGLLINRLKIQDAVLKDPEIVSEEITRPVFVLGFLRTGTTWLHQLLTADPAARPLQAWEGVLPVPSPRPETYETDPRIKHVEKGLKGLDAILPAMRAIHPIHARGPEECLPLLWTTLMTPYYRGRAGSYREWLKTQPVEEFNAAYRYYRLQLQILQRYVRKEHWALKSPAHLAYVDALLHVFPDAVVVHTHRDPQAVIPSWCSMTATLDQLFYSKVDLADVGQRTMSILRYTLDRYRQARAALPAGRIIDVGYDELMADPRSVVERIYQTSGMNYSATVDQAVRARIDGDHHQSRPKHRYSAEEYGLSREMIDRELADYLQDFGSYCGRSDLRPASNSPVSAPVATVPAELTS